MQLFHPDELRNRNHRKIFRTPKERLDTWVQRMQRSYESLRKKQQWPQNFLLPLEVQLPNHFRTRVVVLTDSGELRLGCAGGKYLGMLYG